MRGSRWKVHCAALRVGVVTTATLILSLSVVACDEDLKAQVAALGEGCLLDSDCAVGLRCYARRCHTACVTSEDCPFGPDGERLRCVVGQKPENVCQLADETNCTHDSHCPAPQICGLDDRCRDGCREDRDCVAGQVCRAATCADPQELQKNQLIPASDDSVGKSCRYSSECPPTPEGLALLCREETCSIGCQETRDCPRFYRCSNVLDPSAPGSCALIGERGSLYCDPRPSSPDAEAVCACLDGTTRIQTCKPDGSGFDPCPCP